MSLLDSKLSIGSYVKMLRAKAQEFNDLADQLEAAPALLEQTLPVRKTTSQTSVTKPAASTPTIKQRKPHTRKQITPQERNKFISLYNNGWGLAKIANDYNRHYMTVRKIIQEAKIAGQVPINTQETVAFPTSVAAAE